MKIAVSCDHRGLAACKFLADLLSEQGHAVTEHYEGEDIGCCDYPDRAFTVAKAVADGEVERGILICGSGIGMCIAANKVPGVRAALVHDEFGAELSRRHNDANVLCLSGDTLSMKIIGKIGQTWTSTQFEGGRHARRVSKIGAIERGEDPRQMAVTDKESSTVTDLAV
jgi:ribose 5-phosphate isomerase B